MGYHRADCSRGASWIGVPPASMTRVLTTGHHQAAAVEPARSGPMRWPARARPDRRRNKRLDRSLRGSVGWPASSASQAGSCSRSAHVRHVNPGAVTGPLPREFLLTARVGQVFLPTLLVGVCVTYGLLERAIGPGWPAAPDHAGAHDFPRGAHRGFRRFSAIGDTRCGDGRVRGSCDAHIRRVKAARQRRGRQGRRATTDAVSRSPAVGEVSALCLRRRTEALSPR